MEKRKAKIIQNTLNITSTTYNETFEFLLSRENWQRFDNLPAVCDGVLHAVFEMVFDCAPDKDRASELIQHRLNHFLND